MDHELAHDPPQMPFVHRNQEVRPVRRILDFIHQPPMVEDETAGANYAASRHA
jgi:hypothetical protein